MIPAKNSSLAEMVKNSRDNALELVKLECNANDDQSEARPSANATAQSQLMEVHNLEMQFSSSPLATRELFVDENDITPMHSKKHQQHADVVGDTSSTEKPSTEARPIAAVLPVKAEAIKAKCGVELVNSNEVIEVGRFEVDSRSQEASANMEIPESPIEDFCHFHALASTAAALFQSPRFIPPAVLWYSCVMFDSKILIELTVHEEQNRQLFTTAAMGRMMAENLKKEGHSWPGVEQMNWRKPFIVLDIITGNLDRTSEPPGSCPFLRVQEKEAAGSPARLWNLVIGRDCENLALEMIRLYNSNVKTTVIVWGAQKHIYPKSWAEDVEGELLLIPTNKEDDVLSVLIFHHENLTLERGKLIHRPFPDSELWHLLDPELGYRTLMQMDIRGHPGHPTHFTLHTMKLYPSSHGLPAQVHPRPLVPIPEDGGRVFDDDESSVEFSSEDKRPFYEDMEEEMWHDFVSISRADSRAASKSPEKRAHSDLVECPERLSQKPKIDSSGTMGSKNPVKGEADLVVAAGVDNLLSKGNNVNRGALLVDEIQNSGQHEVQLNETKTLKMRPSEKLPLVTDSERKMILTQEVRFDGDEESQNIPLELVNENDDDKVATTCPTTPPRDSHHTSQQANVDSFAENSLWYDFSGVIDQL